MSRIAKAPVDLPQGVTATLAEGSVTIKGAKGSLSLPLAAEIRDIRPPEPYKGKGVRYAGEQISLKEGKKK